MFVGVGVAVGGTGVFVGVGVAVGGGGEEVVADTFRWPPADKVCQLPLTKTFKLFAMDHPLFEGVLTSLPSVVTDHLYAPVPAALPVPATCMKYVVSLERSQPEPEHV